MTRLIIALLLMGASASAQTIINPGGGSGSGLPGGSATQVQFNNAGAFGGLAGSSVYSPALPTPAAPTVVVSGTAGTTGYRYTVNAVGGLGYSISSPVTDVTTGNSALSSTNFNAVTTSAVTGATSCDVWMFTPVTSGFGKYIGNVACGGTINDKGSVATPYPTNQVAPSGSNPYTVRDASAGVSMPNLIVTNNALIGNGTLAKLGHSPENTSGGAILTIANDLTGTSINSSEDGSNIYSAQNIAPAVDHAINQPWNIQAITTVSPTNAFFIDALEGVVGVLTLAGSGQIDQVDAGLFQTQASGTFNSGFAIDGVQASVFWGSSGTFTSLYAANFVAIETAGSGTEIDGIRVKVNVTGGSATTADGIKIFPPGLGGTVTTYNGLEIMDGSGQGTTSQGIRVRGASWQSLFDGQIKVASLVNGGTPFTVSGCGSVTAGGASAGIITSATTGACSPVVTMGASTKAAPTGWTCWVSNQTTANLIRQTGSTTTTATFSGTTVSGDVLNFGCEGY